MKTRPAVFAVHDTYHIMVQTTEESMMWVRIGDKEYFDESNGILRSRTQIHRMIVPMIELDQAGSYTICERKIIERKAYFTETDDIKEVSFDFKPVNGDNIRCYHIADAHNMAEEPIAAAQAYGKIDFLIMNGDIPDSSDKLEYFDSIYRIASEITKGEIPIVFARGNHDMRGKYAENMIEYIPNANGRTYFTFRLGRIWGIVLDCGEDKEDGHPEYGNTVCCHVFRKEQTEFLKNTIKQREYLADGIQWRVVVVHNPFSVPQKNIFDIERKLYAEWAELLKKHIKPNVMITGHEHCLKVLFPGEAEDKIGHPCPVIIGARPVTKERYFAGAGISFEKNTIRVTFTDNSKEKGGILNEIRIF